MGENYTGTADDRRYSSEAVDVTYYRNGRGFSPVIVRPTRLSRRYPCVPPARCTRSVTMAAQGKLCPAKT
jgi:hypothetical protein